MIKVTQEYRHALIVTHLLPEEQANLISQAYALRDAWPNIKLSLIHVLHKIPSFYFQVPSLSEIQDKLYDDAVRNIERLAQRLDIPKADQYVVLGSVEREILFMAKKLGVDLIITSEEEDTGFWHHSVANRLIHKAPCNVLCVSDRHH